MSKALGAAKLAANMLDRDGTPVRIEAAQILLTEVSALEMQRDELFEESRKLVSKLKELAIHPSHYAALEAAIAKVTAPA